MDRELNIRLSEERGSVNLGWLNSKHSFSFGEYYDPRNMGFEALRVINEDKVAGGAGFPKHPHDNMEIITYVLEGDLEHKDSMGNSLIIKPNEVQRMSAGSGITHSEYNHSKKQEVHLLQIWLFPKERNIEPSYEQKVFTKASKLGKLQLIVSPEGRDGSLSINQNVEIYSSILENEKQSVSHSLAKGHKAWIQVAKGTLKINDREVRAGDGVATAAGIDLTFNGGIDSEFILFDLAPRS